MSMRIPIICVYLAILPLISEARRDGSIPASACSDMRPQHPGEIQASTSPYEIFAGTAFFIPGQTLWVYLENTSDSIPPFMGYYCQGRKENFPDEVAGQFVHLNVNVRGHQCFGQTAATDAFNTVSHNTEWSSDPGHGLFLSWQTSDMQIERVKFRCTFVQSLTTYWTMVESRVVKSLKNESSTECCEADHVPEDCQPLCRRITEEPGSATVARNVLENTGENDSICHFFDAQRALRCSYWSATANQLDDSALEGCCRSRNVSNECMVFCEKEIFATMNYYAEDLMTCFNENPDLSLCIIYPETSDFNTSTVSTIRTTTTSATTLFNPTTSPIATTHFSTRSPSTETSDITTSTVSTTRTTAATTTSATTISNPTSPPITTHFSSRSSSTKSSDITTSTVSTTWTKTATPSSATTISNSTTPPMTTHFPTGFPSITSTAIPEYATVTRSPDSTMTAGSGSVPSPITNPTQPTNFPPETSGIVVFSITCTVNVDGAIQDEGLRQSVLRGLRAILLIPGLAAIAGYIEVRVPVRIYEGSLIVVSEGRFVQQNDGSVPLTGEVQSALDTRLGEINNEINDQNQYWSITEPIEVVRKEINGLCRNVNCGSQKVCIEIGSSESLCLCLDSNNVEIRCDDGSSGLSDGAIAGIVAGLLLVLIVLIVVAVFVWRSRFTSCLSPKKSQKPSPEIQRQKSALSGEHYVYPDSAGANEEPLYMDIATHVPSLPAPNRTGTLPSYSVTYELPNAHQHHFRPPGIQELRENKDGYMEPVPIETEYTEPYSTNATVSEYDDSSFAGKVESDIINADPGRDLACETVKKTNDAELGVNSEEYISLDDYEFVTPKVRDENKDLDHEESSLNT